MSTVIEIIAVIIAVGSYLIWLAGRLDRLQVRVEAARASLDAQLVRRAAAAETLAGLEPDAETSAALSHAAAVVLAGPFEAEAAESALTRAIRASLGAAAETEQRAVTLARATLVDTSTRVRYARQFHNDTVHASLALRRRRLVRWLRLWGTSTAPEYFEIDDTTS